MFQHFIRGITIEYISFLLKRLRAEARLLTRKIACYGYMSSILKRLPAEAPPFDKKTSLRLTDLQSCAHPIFETDFSPARSAPKSDQPQPCGSLHQI